MPEVFERVFLNSETEDPFGSKIFPTIGVFAGMLFAVAIKLAPILSATN
jgi:preprotein translocase subunit Sec61beta